MAFTVDENKNYSLRVEVLNTSTRGGVPTAATLRFGVSVYLETTPLTLIPSQIAAYSFAAGERKIFQFPLTIPVGVSGASGTMDAWLERPDGTIIGGHTFEALIVSGIHAMPPFIGEPALPPPGTGVPTAEEVAAVKATIRYRFEHLWFGVCDAIHYTTEMSQALVLSVAPMTPIVDRYTAELQRISDVWHAANDTQLNFFTDQMKELARQLGVASAGFTAAMAILPGAIRYSENQPLSSVQIVDVTRIDPVTHDNPLLGYFTDFMSGEAKTIALYWPCTMVDGGFSGGKLAEAYQSYHDSWQILMSQLPPLLLPTQRIRDTLRLYGVWYCGFSLGY